MMYWNGDWNGWAWFLMALSIVAFWSLVVVAEWLVVRATRANQPTPPASASAEDILRQRYAAGDIDDEEFSRRLRTLRADELAHH